MSLPKLESYERKKSKTENIVPVVNGVHLHSIYNPIKEAQTLIEKHTQHFQEKSSVLCLGLGLGYHVNEASYLLKKNFNSNFEIMVIEPIQKLHDEALKLNILINENLTIFSGKDVDYLYSDKTLIKFLLKKPYIMIHPASFNLHKTFFSDFLTHKASNCLEKIKSIVDDQGCKSYLEEFPSNINIDDCIKNFIEGSDLINNDLDFLFLAYQQLSKQAFSSTERDKCQKIY